MSAVHPVHDDEHTIEVPSQEAPGRTALDNSMRASAPKDLFTIMDKPITKIESSCDSQCLGRSIRLMKSVMLPEVLKELMSQRGLHVRSLSKECKIPVSTLSTYLSGKKASYSPEHLRLLSEFFGVTIDFLLYRKSPPTSANLDLLKTESLFSGWVKIRVERAIPDKKDEE